MTTNFKYTKEEQEFFHNALRQSEPVNIWEDPHGEPTETGTQIIKQIPRSIRHVIGLHCIMGIIEK